MPRNLFTSSMFRLSVVYTAIFASSVLVLMGYLYSATAGYMLSQTDETIEAEIEGLADVYQRQGLNGLVGVIRGRIARDPGRSSIYLLADANYRPLIGNLDGWPAAGPDSTGWIEFEIRDSTADKDQAARGRPFRLRGGFNLLVGRDVNELSTMTALIERALVWGMVITLGLGFAGGAIFSLRSLRRLESIKQTSQRVMDGDLTQRVPVSDGTDDIDKLAHNLNSMLDRLEHSMTGIRHVSDNIAHDLKTPLTRLRNRLKGLLDRSDSEQPDLAKIAVCVDEVDALLTTFDALLRIARLEAGAARTKKTAVRLHEVLASVCDLYEPLAQDRGLSVAWTGDPVTVPGDEAFLVQAISNVIDNAVKYSPRGATIRVSLEARGATARLCIADSGPGISPTDNERIFDRFYRGDHSRGTPGSGLGLSLAKAVFDYHEATLTLADNQPGLRFIVDIPALQGSKRDAA